MKAGPRKPAAPRPAAKKPAAKKPAVKRPAAKRPAAKRPAPQRPASAASAPLRRRPPTATTKKKRTKRQKSSVRGSSTLRLRVGFIVIALVMSLYAARLIQLQGVDPNQYAQMAAAEGSVSVVLPAERGEILDRNGVPLAKSADGLMIVVDPSVVKADDTAPLATLLSKKLHLDYFATLERLRAHDSKFQYLARQVPASRAKAVVQIAVARGFKGLATREDPVRYYPYKQVAANLVGFLGTPKEDGAAHPLAGMEVTFDDYLAGIDGSEQYRSGAGSRIPLGDDTIVPAQDGHDLTTTIDSDLQFYTQRVVADTVRSSGAESGFAVIMDSQTGEVLSLADYPTYDASSPEQYPESTYNSRALTDVYEPGSVEKVLTVSGLIDAGKVTDKTRFEVPQVLNRQDRPIHDYFIHPSDPYRLTMAGIIAKSSNIGTVMAADKFAPGQLRSYLTSFGLGRQTGVGSAYENPGVLPDGSMWTSQTGDRIAFGQSLSVNGLQMAAAVNTIANGGVRVDPSLVRGSATMANGKEVGTATATKHRVVSTDAATQTMLMMERVVDPDVGVAPLAQVEGYRVAGKTGTAQRVNNDCGCYDGTHTVSFGGFAPADDPKFTIYVVIQNPRSGGGGSVAGPAFSQLMGYTLKRYGVPPTGTEPSRLPTEW